MAPQDGLLREWLSIIRGEFLEIPGLRLTRREFQRMWNLDALTCDSLIRSLEESQFLRQTAQGAYVRADSTA
jgi:hypothetical protein